MLQKDPKAGTTQYGALTLFDASFQTTSRDGTVLGHTAGHSISTPPGRR